MGKGGISSRILNVSTAWNWTASDFGRLTPWGKNPMYSLYNKLGGSQNRSERIGIEKNPLPQPGIKRQFLGCPRLSWSLC